MMPASLRNCDPPLVEDGSCVGHLDAFHHFDGRGLAGAVGPEQTETAALPDPEADVVDRG
jgi:hypothetical protein